MSLDATVKSLDRDRACLALVDCRLESISAEIGLNVGDLERVDGKEL